MPSLKAVRTRIASVKSTQKITRAMKLVYAAKLRRAQDGIIAARPYARQLAAAVAQVAARAGEDAHPMLKPRPGNSYAVVVLTSDRGLCGGFNANISRAAMRFVQEKRAEGGTVKVVVVGRKGRDFLKRRGIEADKFLPGAVGETAQDRARELALTVTELFMVDGVDQVYLAYNEFKSAMSQRVVVDQLLPIQAAELPEEAKALDLLFEPSKEDLLQILLPLYLESQMFRSLLESIASEFGARMTAMESATKNAKEMIQRLTLLYNRARQAAITKELMEIVGGAEALKG